MVHITCVLTKHKHFKKKHIKEQIMANAERVVIQMAFMFQLKDEWLSEY